MEVVDGSIEVVVVVIRDVVLVVGITEVVVVGCTVVVVVGTSDDVLLDVVGCTVVVVVGISDEVLLEVVVVVIRDVVLVVGITEVVVVGCTVVVVVGTSDDVLLDVVGCTVVVVVGISDEVLLEVIGATVEVVVVGMGVPKTCISASPTFTVVLLTPVTVNVRLVITRAGRKVASVAVPLLFKEPTSRLGPSLKVSVALRMLSPRLGRS